MGFGWSEELMRLCRELPLPLANVECSCYVNSVLQCLAWTAPLAARCKGGCHLTPRDNELQSSLGSTMLHCTDKDNHSAFTPMRFLNEMSHSLGPNFDGHTQQDAMELFNSLVVMCPSLLSDEFHFTTTVHRFCTNCRYTSTSNNIDYFSVSVPVSKYHVKTLADALSQAYFNKEVLQCSKCKKETYICATSINNPPIVLAVQLLRFDFSRAQRGQPRELIKIWKHIAFPDTLDLRPYIHKSSGAAGLNNSYTLYGMVVHNGDKLEYGHYISYVKLPAQDEVSYQWYECNEKRITTVKAADVMGK